MTVFRTTFAAGLGVGFGLGEDVGLGTGVGKGVTEGAEVVVGLFSVGVGGGVGLFSLGTACVVVGLVHDARVMIAAVAVNVIVAAANTAREELLIYLLYIRFLYTRQPGLKCYNFVTFLDWTGNHAQILTRTRKESPKDHYDDKG